ncbi:hypothetical protein FRC11_000435, partial [Ceratobasidium sp. 423]
PKPTAPPPKTTISTPKMTDSTYSAPKLTASSHKTMSTPKTTISAPKATMSTPKVSSLPPPEPAITKLQAMQSKKSQATMYIGTNKHQALEELEIARKCPCIEPTGQKVPPGAVWKKPRKSGSLVILPSSDNQASGLGCQCTTSSQPPPVKAKATKPLASGDRLPLQALANQSQCKGAVAPCH